jgi:hypothetical protein
VILAGDTSEHGESRLGALVPRFRGDDVGVGQGLSVLIQDMHETL